MEMGKAISQKIREAIRAKLIDLGNYVDEELPDYIMVMIANKKTEEQMKDDLVLFLGANTDKFCGWLQGVLKKLQAARDEQKERKEKSKEKKKKGKKKDDKKEKKHRTSSETKEDEKGEGSKSSAGKDLVKQPDETTSSTDTAQIPAIVEASQQPTRIASQQHVQTASQKPTQIVSQKPMHTASKARTETVVVSESTMPSSSQPVISLLPDTNDFLDEEIMMNEASKKATASDSLKSTQVKGSGKMQSTRSKISDPEKTRKVSSKAVVKESRERSPPLTVTIGGGSSRIQARIRPESVPARVRPESARGSVKSRLGAPAVKRKAEMEERPRILTTMSTVVKVPIVTMKRSGPGSVIGQVIEGNEEDSDDEPANKRVASTVKPRRRLPLPKTKHNSMSLLKRAMTQAQESTSIFPAAGQFTEPRRMIVRSASQSGTMKIVTRSIPADKEPRSKIEAVPKKMLKAAVRAASTVTPKPSNKATVSIRPLGLMSRSRFKEANERDFDAHMYQRVEKEAEQDKAKEEEEVVEEVVVKEEEVDDKEDYIIVEEKEVEEQSELESQEESLDGDDDQRQIIDTTEAESNKAEAVVIVESAEEDDMKMVELITEEEEKEEEDDGGMEIQEPVYDTRNTTIVRPLQFERLTCTSMERRERLPQPPVYQPPQPAPEDSNPRFIVTMEGKKPSPTLNQDTRGVRNWVSAPPILPQYQPTPIMRLNPNQQTLFSRYESIEEMEMDVLEEKIFDYKPAQPMQYQQEMMKDRSPEIMEKEIPTKRVGPTEHLKDSLYSPPQPKVAPVTFTLQESDEEHGHAEMDEKVNERCKFWPACKNGSDCPFFHPSTPCRTFPNCKFGDKCLFIHPNCKFDATCMNPTCPYTHATRTKPAPVIIQAPPVRAFHSFKQSAVNKTVCRFHPNCSNTKCPFFHPSPKMCRYNRSCTRPDCKFQHTQVASRSAMKWTKDQHISERKFASKPPTSQTSPS